MYSCPALFLTSDIAFYVIFQLNFCSFMHISHWIRVRQLTWRWAEQPNAPPISAWTIVRMVIALAGQSYFNPGIQSALGDSKSVGLMPQQVPSQRPSSAMCRPGFTYALRWMPKVTTTSRARFVKDPDTKVKTEEQLTNSVAIYR